jgi:hypothetical protein
LTEKQVRGRRLDPLVQPSDDLGARRVGQAGELIEVLVEVGGVSGPLAGGAYQESALAGGKDLDERTDAAASRRKRRLNL